MRGTSLPWLTLAFLLTVAWVAGPVLGQPSAPLMPGPRTIVAGQGLAGIAIGASIDAVVTRFHAPSAVVRTDRDAVYIWQRFGINAYVRDGLIIALSTSNSLMRVGAIGPGFRVDDAIRAFGAVYQRGSVEGFQGLRFDEPGIAFGLDRTTVAVILVFAPGQAAQVSGLQGPQRAYGTMTNYMSLSGYLRWLVYQSSANWITLAEASRMVQEHQTTTAHHGGE